MPNRHIPFPPRAHGLVLSDTEHAFLLDIIGPFQGPDVQDLLQRAVPATGGRRIIGTDNDIDALLAAVDIEANGFLRVESENAGRQLRKPKPGGNADRLRRLADKIEQYLS